MTTPATDPMDRFTWQPGDVTWETDDATEDQQSPDTQEPQGDRRNV